MSVQANVLPREPLHLVRVVASGVPAGVDWTIHGTTGGGEEWLVASGTSTGGQIVTVDPWAPLGLDTTYRLRHGVAVEQSGTVRRTYPGHAAITDLSGRTVADVRWMRGDARESEPRAHFSQVPGARYAPARLAPVAGAGGGKLTVRAMQPHVHTLDRLLATNRPLIVLHNHLSPIPGCVVEPVRTIHVTSDPNDVVPRVDRGQREWNLSYRLAAPGVVGGVIAVVTLGDLKAAFPTLGAIKATGMTIGDLKLGNWLYP